MSNRFHKITRSLASLSLAFCMTSCGAIVPPSMDSVEESFTSSYSKADKGSGDTIALTITPSSLPEVSLTPNVTEPTPTASPVVTPSLEASSDIHFTLDEYSQYKPVKLDNIKDQLAVISANKAVWYVDLENGYLTQMYDYAITDLDANGRVEIVQATCQGTGFFSANKLWEVNDSFDGLDQVIVNESDYVSDIVSSDDAVLYYNSSDKSIHYIFNDYIRNGMIGNANTVMDFELKDGEITENPIATQINLYDDLGQESVEYKNADGESLSEEEYQFRDTVLFANCRQGSVTIGWARHLKLDIDGATGPYLNEVLYEMCDNFLINIPSKQAR